LGSARVVRAVPWWRAFCAWFVFLSGLAAMGLKVCDRMAGMFLPFAGLGKEAMHVVSTRRGQFILDAPDFLQHDIGALIRLHSFSDWFFPVFQRFLSFVG
jgi:hypothetical protein